MMKITVKRALSFLLCALMVLSTMSVGMPFTVSAANGDFYPVHYDSDIGYADVPAGSYAVVDGDHAMQVTQSGSSYYVDDMVITDGDLTGATVWTFSKNSNGTYSIKYNTASLSLNDSTQFYITSVSPNTVIIQSAANRGIFLAYDSESGTFGEVTEEIPVQLYRYTPEEYSDSYIYERSAPEAGEKYIIVSTDGYAINSTFRYTQVSVSSSRLTYSSSSTTRTNLEMELVSASSGTLNISPTSTGGYLSTTEMSTTSSAPSNGFTISGDSSYKITGTLKDRKYLQWDKDKHEFAKDSKRASSFYFYKLIEEPHPVTEESYDLENYAIDPNKTIYTPDKWAKLDTCTVVNIRGINAIDLNSMIRGSEDFAVYTTENSDYSNPVKLSNSDTGISFDFSGVLFNQVGTYSVPVKYGSNTAGNPVTIGTVTVQLLAERPVVSGVMNKNEGVVYRYAAATDDTGDTADVVRDDGSMDTVHITVGMLSGNFDLNTPGTYTGLSVTCGGKVISTDFTLTVKDVAQSAYFVKYTPNQSGQYVENGNYIIYNARTENLPDPTKGIILTPYFDTAAIGSQDFTIDGNIMYCDPENVYSITRSGTSGNNYYVQNINGKYLSVYTSNVVDGGARGGITMGSSAATVSFMVNSGYTDNIVITNVSGTHYYMNRWSDECVFGIWQSGFDDPGSRVQLYKEKKVYYALSSCETTITAGDSFSEESLYSLVNIKIIDGETKETSETVRLDDSRATITWPEGFNSYTPGDYPAQISIDGVVVDTYTVHVQEDKDIDSIELVNNSGSVNEKSPRTSYVGAYVMVNYTDGSSRLVPVTVSMLSGDYDLEVVDAYPGLTVKYGDLVLSEDFTLYVEGLNDYPEYPENGSVKLNKSATAPDFSTNGVARVQLSAAGVPLNKGIDVVIVLDTSSSMGSDAYIGTYRGEFVSYSRGDGYWYYEGGISTGLSGTGNSAINNTGVMRIDVLRQSLSNLLANLAKPNSLGQSRDIDVAICGFNGMSFIDGTNYPHASDQSGYNNQDNNAAVYTGSKNLTAGAFVDINDLQNFDPNTIKTFSGTNYDYAFQEAYELITAKQAKNANEERDTYVIFMSDGAPYQYNYMGSNNYSNNWNNMLKGTYTSIGSVPISNTTYRYFYNTDQNKHWMAEAIKGDPDKLYTIIDPKQTTAVMDVTGDGVNDRYMRQINGLGAKMYSIGFCLAPDYNIEYNTMSNLIRKLATSDEYFYLANSAISLDSAFDAIDNDMAFAGTNAYFLDTMGACYDLQKSASYTKNGVTYTLDPAPNITFVDYTLYTKKDYLTGVIDDYNLIGTRTGEKEVIETITFNSTGTEAYSSKITQSGSSTVHPNIMGDDGVIYGSTFIYNTSQNTVLIDPTGGNNKTFSLPPETFYWNMNIIEEVEHCLEYDVYLTGSMEGTRPAGTYPTNESASLYYTNYLDHPCHMDTVSPQLPWESANINYEFYLVNANGEPVNTNGDVVPFANRVLVGKPQSKELLLNNIVSTGADVAAKDVIPAGYTLYNPDASFTVAIDSGTTPSSATITDNKNVYNSDSKVTTFYYDSNSICNKNGTVSGVDNYFDTHVAFAVILMPTVIPDAVVIDYGIPVSISLLANDLAIPIGTSPSFISAEISAGTVLNNRAYGQSQFESNAKSLTLKHGIAELRNDKLIYTPTDAEMDEEEIIYYEVIVGGKYYYSTVTVYPAQNIYYEDDFFTFTPEESWLTAGTRKDAYQAEDRPGSFNLADIDFNNVYGYDAAYDDTTVTYSLRSARYARVNKDTPKSGASQPLASFTFRGTGFDLFSVTTNRSGSAKVRVYSGDELIDNFAVNTYYGYTYNSETDEFEPDDSAEGGLYQIPIIRARDYEYGTYRVEVAPWYTTVTDHQKRGYYDIYIDGIRIYDPADPNPSDTIKEVYKQDVEANSTYIELRSNIISANNFYALSTTPGALKGAAPGIMFIDSIAELSPGSYAEAYKKFTEVGPNNEIYLKQGQAIAFFLELGDIHDAPASIQLGMKVPGGNANGSVLLMNSAQEAPQKITIQGAAPRYYDITNAFSWNKDLLDVDNLRGLKAEDITVGQDSVAGEYTASEWTFIQSGSGWKLGDANNNNVVLARQESGLITASFAPNGTGDVFRAEAENGLFTFANSIGYSFGYNGVVTGVEYGGASFRVYSANGDGTYTRVKTAEDLVDGEKYLMVYTSAKTMLVSPSMATASATSKTYKTLYPVVIMNNGEGILSLTNLKVVFNDYDSAASLKSSVSSSAKMASFASMAAGAFATNPDYEDEAKINIADITTEFVAGDKETGARGTLYIRTPGNIESVIVGDDEVTEYTRNGDGTRTFAYHFDVEYDPETAGYVITVKDADGNTDKLIKAGQLELVEILPEATDEPGTDEPGTGEEEGGFLSWLRFHVNLIIEFFKSIIRWVKSII